MLMEVTTAKTMVAAVELDGWLAGWLARCMNICTANSCNLLNE